MIIPKIKSTTVIRFLRYAVGFFQDVSKCPTKGLSDELVCVCECMCSCSAFVCVCV